MQTFCVQYLKIEYRCQMSSKHCWFNYFIFHLSYCRHTSGQCNKWRHHMRST